MSLKVNGEHKEKILQRWEGGDGASDDYDLDSDMVRRKKNGAKSTPPPHFFFLHPPSPFSPFFPPIPQSNGWDPNEMFKFNEENYGVKTTYDSSLASYTYANPPSPPASLISI